MADIAQPRPGRMYWTAYQQPDGDTRPVDPLAFDMYAERLGNLLVPGITGRTTRIRYLGMVCAGLLLVSERVRPGRERVHRARRDAFLPFERAWALSVCEAAHGALKERGPGTNRLALKYEYRDLRGTNHVLAYWRAQHSGGAS